MRVITFSSGRTIVWVALAAVKMDGRITSSGADVSLSEEVPNGGPAVWRRDPRHACFCMSV